MKFQNEHGPGIVIITSVPVQGDPSSKLPFTPMTDRETAIGK